MSRLCEEFKCLPSEALREWRRHPSGFLEDIVEARQFAAAYATYEANGGTTDKLTPSPMLDLVQTLEFEQAQAEIDAKRAAESGG